MTLFVCRYHSRFLLCGPFSVSAFFSLNFSDRTRTGVFNMIWHSKVVLVTIAMSMVLDIEKKDKCQKSDLENALTGAVLKIEVSYAHGHGLRHWKMWSTFLSEIWKIILSARIPIWRLSLTGAVLKIEVSYAHQLSCGHLWTSPPNVIKIRSVFSFGQCGPGHGLRHWKKRQVPEIRSGECSHRCRFKDRGLICSPWSQKLKCLDNLDNLENALTATVFEIEVSYAHQLCLGHQ